MKKSLLIAAGAAFAAIAVSVFVYVNNGKNEMDDLFNANVEALAKIEEPGEGVYCHNTITTAQGMQVLYCGTCSYIDGKSTLFSGHGYCLPL